MEVTDLSVDVIKPYWRNPRVNDEAVAKVALSIEKFGFQQPLVVDKNYVVIVGHTRLKAARSLKMTQVPCVVAEMTEEHARAYRIADNATGEWSDWDHKKLVPELRALESDDLGALMREVMRLNVDDMLRDSSGEEYQPPSEDEVKDAEKEKDEAHDEQGGEYQDLIEVMCPHCGEGFEIEAKHLPSIVK